MNLQYLYIKEHQIFGEQNINFGGRFRFHFDPHTSDLIVKENPQYVPNFFSPQNYKIDDAVIAQITAVVGQNGAGKTSLIDFITNNFSDGFNGTRHDLILCIGNDDKSTIYLVGDIMINNHNLQEYLIDLKIHTSNNVSNSVNVSSKSLRNTINIKAFDKTHFIYLSNIFDGNSAIELEGLKDLSTNYLIRNARLQAIELNILDRNDTNDLQAYTYNELDRQIDFVQLFDDIEVIPFKLPEKLNVTLKRVYHDGDTSLGNLERQAVKNLGIDILISLIFECCRKWIGVTMY